MIKNQEEGCDSQFIKGCNTTWNLNHEFICWINYWFKKYKEEADIDLQFYRFTVNGVQMTQGEAIDRVIELTDYIESDFYDFEDKERDKAVNEVFDIFKEIFWCMWW